MHRLPVVALVTLAVSFGFTGCGSASGNPVLPQFPPSALLPQAAIGQHSPKPAKAMRAFRSEAELAAYLKQMDERQRRTRQESGLFTKALSVMGQNAPAAAPAKDMAAGAAEQESITNVQHAGVDEGSIVKLHGDHLVILRRGRLFTVSIGRGDLTPISAVDAYGPDVDPSGTWYDEMLVSKDTVAVIGYSYQRGGTEVGLFNIDSAGTLSYRSTYQLRSNDYYSSRNYASRLIGDKLIFYSPLYLYAGDYAEHFPAVRRWHKGASSGDFQRILPATQVYVPTGADFSSVEALHTVTVCDLAGGGFDCKATSVIGPPGRVFYVSPESVYVWMTDWAYGGSKPAERSILYRMPLDGSAPSALKVSGSPVDQFSFLESGDGHLNVLVRSNSSGDGMWGAELAAGSVALMRVAVNNFSDGSERVPGESYRQLPTPQGYTFQNRFVGDYLLYGTGSGWGEPQQASRGQLYAAPWAGGQVQRLPLNHGVDRIEQMGTNAVVVGTDGTDLHFTAVRLGYSAEVADEYVRKGASQGELRSHGFFYKPESEDSGMLGLPIALPARAGYRHLFENPAGILFLRNKNLHFEEVGELYAEDGKAVDDGCRASCVDWYGNAQPLFIRGRVLALLGYELVEGRLSRGQLRETQRVNFAGQIMAASKR